MMDMDTKDGISIGYISACIAGDYRYTTRVEVFLSQDYKTVKIVRSENGASGGMDGRGGSDPFCVTGGATVKAIPSEVVKAIKGCFDNVITRYGKPTKKFHWTGLRKSGLSASLVKDAIAYEQA